MGLWNLQTKNCSKTKDKNEFSISNFFLKSLYKQDLIV